MPTVASPIADPVPSSDSVLERTRELAAIDVAVDRTAAGVGGGIVIGGEPGIGKTTLVRHAADRAARSGLRVLRAQGGELERSLPYGIVMQLFGTIARDPELAADLLGGPAAAAASLLGLRNDAATRIEPDGARDPLAYLHGLFWLTLNLTERGPIAVIVDDAQWADEPSLRFVLRLLQQAEELPVLVVLAMRPDTADDSSVAAKLIRVHSAVTRLTPRPLTEDAVGRILAGSESAIDPEVRRACWQATRGNPFYVRAVATELARARPEVRGIEAAQAIGSFVPERVGRFLEARLAVGGTMARSVAEAAAVLGESATLHRAALLAGIDGRSAEAAARWLVEAAILEDAGRLVFRHPIVRSGVDASIPGPVRAALHRRAAYVLADEGVEIGVVGAHLRETEPSGESRAVELLRSAASDAMGRGEADTAVELLRRALAEPPPLHDRADVLVDLARAQARLGSSDATASYVEAIDLIGDRLRRSELLLELGHALVRAGDFPGAAGRFREGIDELDGTNDPLRARLEAGLVASSWMGGRHDPAADLIGARILSQPSFGPAHRELVASVAFQRSISGTARCDEMVELVERILAEAPVEQLTGEGQLLQLLTGVLFSSDELEQHHELLTHALAAAEAAGDYAKVGLYASARGWSDYLTGRLGEAVADTETAIRAGELGWEVFLPAAVGIQAIARIERGELDAAETLLAIDPEPWSRRADWIVWLVARARLSAARGALDRSLSEFEIAAAFGERFGYRNPGPPAWRRWQAEVLARSGNTTDARRIAGEAVTIAEAWGARWPLGAALWSQGIAEGGTRGIELLRRAVAVLHGGPAHLEEARALVELGGALRRNGSLVEARETLARAADLSHRIGALGLLERATTELTAAGARPRRIALTGVASLTPAELRVAGEAAAGRTNREIAQALFVTPKAVEFHLANAYRKLGIGGRGELASAMGSSGQPPETAGIT